MSTSTVVINVMCNYYLGCCVLWTNLLSFFFFFKVPSLLFLLFKAKLVLLLAGQLQA